MDKSFHPLDQHFNMPQVRHVEASRPFRWLAMGMSDMRDNLVASLSYGLFFAVLGYLILAYAADMPYLFTAAVVDAAGRIAPSGRGELEITDAIQWLIDHGRLVRPHVIEGWWKDTGRLEDMLEANRIILDSLVARTDGLVEESEILGKVVVEAGARIVHSTVRGPAIIGKGAVIENAYVGPFTSIGDGVIVRGSEVEHSILLEGASVSDVGGRIESSLIGRNVSIYRTRSKPRSFNFMLGDRSEVGLIG